MKKANLKGMAVPADSRTTGFRTEIGLEQYQP
jgi:hypothetical protein